MLLYGKDGTHSFEFSNCARTAIFTVLLVSDRLVETSDKREGGKVGWGGRLESYLWLSWIVDRDEIFGSVREGLTFKPRGNSGVPNKFRFSTKVNGQHF